MIYLCIEPRQKAKATDYFFPEEMFFHTIKAEKEINSCDVYNGVNHLCCKMNDD